MYGLDMRRGQVGKIDGKGASGLACNGLQDPGGKRAKRWVVHVEALGLLACDHPITFVTLIAQHAPVDMIWQTRRLRHRLGNRQLFRDALQTQRTCYTTEL